MSFRHLAICLLLTVLPWTGSSRLAADELPSWTSIGPDGGNVQALAASPALPDLILAGLEQGYGVFRSANRGRNWGAASDTFGRIVFDLAIDTRGKAFYAATSRGLLRSTNGGARWVDLEPAPAVYTLVATHPRQAPIVFAVRAGVLLRSTNRGVTREIVQGPVGVAAIAFALSGQRTVVYAGGSNGLWRSTDDGATWTRLSLPVSPPDVQAVAVDSRDPRVLYVGLWHNRRVLLKSLDGGATWTLSQRGLTVPGSAWRSPRILPSGTSGSVRMPRAPRTRTFSTPRRAGPSAAAPMMDRPGAGRRRSPVWASAGSLSIPGSRITSTSSETFSAFRAASSRTAVFSFAAWMRGRPCSASAAPSIFRRSRSWRSIR